MYSFNSLKVVMSTQDINGSNDVLHFPEVTNDIATHSTIITMASNREKTPLSRNKLYVAPPPVLLQPGSSLMTRSLFNVNPAIIQPPVSIEAAANKGVSASIPPTVSIKTAITARCVFEVKQEVTSPPVSIETATFDIDTNMEEI